MINEEDYSAEVRENARAALAGFVQFSLKHWVKRQGDTLATIEAFKEFLDEGLQKDGVEGARDARASLSAAVSTIASEAWLNANGPATADDVLETAHQFLMRLSYPLPSAERTHSPTR